MAMAEVALAGSSRRKFASAAAAATVPMTGVWCQPFFSSWSGSRSTSLAQTS